MKYQCGRCGVSFSDRGKQRRRVRRHVYYCSRSCAFWDHVAMPDPDGCLIWIGPLHKGYGEFLWEGEQTGAHQEAWRQTKGVIPVGLNVLHNCPGRHNKACVLHLYVGTHADNSRDMIAMGQIRSGDQHGLRLHPERIARGSRHGAAKLTEATVLEIRQLAATGTVTQRQIARDFSISFQVISKIVRGDSWRHVYLNDTEPTPSRMFREVRA